MALCAVARVIRPCEPKQEDIQGGSSPALHHPRSHLLTLTLLIDDVDGVYKLLKACDIATESEPEVSRQFNVYQFFVRDPNGYLVEVQRFLEPLT
ncbi:MAG: VOC family protein [Trueperaceae bacterium]